MYLCASANSEPHETSGSWSPAPRKLSKASAPIVKAIVAGITAMTEPREPGTTCRTSRREREAPRALAASTCACSDSRDVDARITRV